jgi:hypothetical protein
MAIAVSVAKRTTGQIISVAAAHRIAVAAIAL